MAQNTDEKKIDLEQARDLMRREAQAIERLAEGLNTDFSRAAQLIYECTGTIVLTGIGKAGIIAQKISATLASTGTPTGYPHDRRNRQRGFPPR